MKLTPEVVEQAKEDYRRALMILKADAVARLSVEKAPTVGKYFRFTEWAGEDTARTWAVYIVVEALNRETAQLQGWHFKQTPDGLFEIRQDADLEPGFLGERCIEIERNEFVAAFNELLTATARFAQRMPQ